jgi:hypothetical protein
MNSLVAYLLVLSLGAFSSVSSRSAANSNDVRALNLISTNPRNPLRLSQEPKKFHSNESVEKAPSITYQALEMYSEHGQSGLMATLYHEYCGDLRVCFGASFDNVISSLRVFGIWLLYDGYGYGINDDRSVVWVWGDDYYFELNGLDNAASSVRFAGWEDDFHAPSLTLFSGEYFKGWEYFVQGDSPSLNWQFPTDSVILTGTYSWALYEYENYRGRSVCLNPGSGNNPGIYPTYNSIGLSNVASVRRGCFFDSDSNQEQRVPVTMEKNVLYSSESFKKE